MMKDENALIPGYILTGRVMHGKGIGSKAGMPTANLEFFPEMDLPDFGVYAAKVLVKDKEYIGVTNVGLRPTVDDEERVSVETYIIDFADDIYGERICLQLYKLLRKQRKFDSMSLLREQLLADCAETKKYFSLL